MNIYVWSNSYLEAQGEAEVLGRLEQAFDARDLGYNFELKYFNSEEG